MLLQCVRNIPFSFFLLAWTASTLCCLRAGILVVQCQCAITVEETARVSVINCMPPNVINWPPNGGSLSPIGSMSY